jgi:magnesium transporter
MIANSAVYRDGSRLHVDVKPDDLEGIRKTVQSGDPGDFVSVGLHEPDEAEMARVAEIFGLHRLAVEDCLHPVQRPKLEQYGDMMFLVLKTLWYVKESDTVEGGQVALFMGPDYVVTVRQGARFETEPVRHDLEEHADVLKQGPAAVVYAVCDRVVDIYEQIVSNLGSDVDEVEAAVFSPQRTHASKRIYELNRELNTLRRAVNPLRAPMHASPRRRSRESRWTRLRSSATSPITWPGSATRSTRWTTCCPAPTTRTCPGSACSRTTTCGGCRRRRRSRRSSQCWRGSTG